MPKHRAHNSKIKREHGMIAGLDAFLQKVEQLPEVKSILTGVITTRKGVGALQFNVQYKTDTGLKCLAKNQGSVQEVFITSAEPELLHPKVIRLASQLH